VDEAGFYLLVKLGKTWAKKGKTPCIEQSCRYQHLSAISAISEQGEMYFQIQNTSFTGLTIVAFLRALLVFFNKKLLIIWDGAKIHHDENVKQFLSNENNDRIFLAKIPPYTPELNADEQVWQTLKDDKLKNVVCKNLTELHQKLEKAFNELKQDVEKIKSFFRHPEVHFYKS
jgi:transposase